MKPNPFSGRRPWGAYRIESTLSVPRNPEAERALGVADRIRIYDVGANGIRGGMTVDEVTDILGEPRENCPLGPMGSFDLLYDRVRVRFLDHEVAHIDAG